MEHVVAKDFKTVNRKFSAGSAVTEADIEGAMSFDNWKTQGFIKAKDEDKAQLKTWAAKLPAPGED